MVQEQIVTLLVELILTPNALGASFGILLYYPTVVLNKRHVV